MKLPALLKIPPRRLLLAGLLIGLAGAAGGIPRARASVVDGTWIIEDLALNLFDCQNRVCGQIVWIKDAARRPSQCGKTIVWNLLSASPTEWDGGSILDPDDGSVYRLSATLEPDGVLRARIYKGVKLLGKTKLLRRIDAHTLAGKC